MKTNFIKNIDCVEGLRELPNDCIDLTLTSPPYDNMRKYNGYSFDFENILAELYRVTKHGGVVAWIVGDKTIKGSETGTSFRQALAFMNQGFNLLDTMIYAKKAVGACGSKYSYNQAFEYMFIFTKGKIKTFNPIKDLVPKNAGKPTKYTKNSKSTSEGYSLETVTKIAPKASKRQNIWTYDIGFAAGNDKTKHPAVFPEQLAEDHILSWTNPGDLVLDIFSGSGTTAKMCLLNNRKFIGFELSKQYYDKSIERLMKYGYMA